MKISYQNQANISNKSLNIRKPAVLLASYENYPAANTSGRDANSVHLNFCGGISRTVIRELDKVKDPMEFVKQACNILRKDAGGDIINVDVSTIYKGYFSGNIYK